ncbi:MAG TPA: leucyl/phenylalanyl-tRNA--protein transferase [Thermoanaerobaculia bacterium]|nr:leucyl/phenylalanyl-tRNA--protein transferase [Thermoanaerobaculia bacterium]
MFPDPRQAPHDIIAIGDDLRPGTLMEAYRRGIFPWPTEEAPLPWFSPRKRAILRFADIHLTRSLERARRRSGLRYTIDADFAGVIAGCASAERPAQEGTWIFPEIIDAYVRLHELGHAHSAEVWEGDELIGGIYGVDMGGAFGGESMFHRRPNASKLALLHLAGHLSSRGLDWMDIQVMTPHMEAFGAVELGREAFLDLLASTQAKRLSLFG